MKEESNTENERYVGDKLAHVDVYHTERHCHNLQRTDGDVRPASQAAIDFHELDECHSCREGFALTNPLNLPEGTVETDMTRVTVRLPKKYIDLLALGQDVGPYQNRCEVIRGALELLSGEIDARAMAQSETTAVNEVIGDD